MKSNMNKTILTIAFVFFGFAFCLAQQFIVATYNVRYDAAGDVGNLWKDRHPHLVQLIKFHGFDIFGTQEGLKHQLEDMQKLLPGYAYIGVGRNDGKDGGEHAAIFYKVDKFEVIKQGNFWLAENTEIPNKGWDAALPESALGGFLRINAQDSNFSCSIRTSIMSVWKHERKAPGLS